MKSLLFSALILAALAINCFAQQSSPLFVVFVDGKFGYMDTSGTLLVKPQFDEAEKFSEGLALVSLGRKKAFIDPTGKIVIEPDGYEPINNFTDGRARVTILKSNTAGYIDKTGKIVIDDGKLWGACEFSEGLACVFGGNGTYIDTAGNYVIKGQFSELNYFREGLASVSVKTKRGFIDKTGAIVIKPLYDVVQSFSEGFAAVGMKSKDEYVFGFIDKTGAMVIKPQFEWTYFFKEGLAAVQVNGKWGFVDKKGLMVIRPRFDKAEHFSEGLAPVATKGKWGFIDKKGKFVIEPQFNEAGNFDHGLSFVKIDGYDAYRTHDVIGYFDTDGKWGYIDKTGKYIWRPTK